MKELQTRFRFVAWDLVWFEVDEAYPGQTSDDLARNYPLQILRSEIDEDGLGRVAAAPLPGWQFILDGDNHLQIVRAA